MSKKSQRRNSSNRRTSPKPAKGAKPAEHTQDYAPAMVNWDSDSYGSEDSFRAVISEERAKYSPDCLPVCQIIVDPRFTPAAARRITNLISFAPRLWQALRTISFMVLDGAASAKTFGGLIELLWLAGEQRPFNWPEPHPDDQFERLKSIPGIDLKTETEKNKLLKLIEAEPLDSVWE